MIISRKGILFFIFTGLIFPISNASVTPEKLVLGIKVNGGISSLPERSVTSFYNYGFKVDYQYTPLFGI